MDEQEMNLEEWMNKLPSSHGAHKEYNKIKTALKEAVEIMDKPLTTHIPSQFAVWKEKYKPMLGRLDL